MLLLPPPIARLAIMPSMSDHFSIKIPTASSPFPLSSSPNIPDCLALSLSLSPLFLLLGQGDACSLMICGCCCPSNSHRRGQRQLTIVRRGTARTASDGVKLPVHSEITPELPHHLLNTQASEQIQSGLRWTCRNTAVTF